MSEQKMKNVEQLDPNMKLQTANEKEWQWISPMENPVQINGLPWFAEEKIYRRLPRNPQWTLPTAVDALANCTAGAQIRFATNSQRLSIRVSLAALVTIYLLVFLAAVFLVWLSSEWNRRRRERKAFRFRLRCVICGFEFEDRTDALLPRCPRCGSLNERFKFERI